MTDTPTLTLEDLGPLVACNECSQPTYHPANIPEAKRLWRLPEDFTAANARKFVYVRRHLITVCTNCRYTVYERY